jgi:uncharacterized lipoprotein YmbA
MMGRVPAFAIACALGALVTGCSSPPANFYTLSATAAPSSTQSKLTVAVGPVSVPSTIDSPQIVVSTGANQVSIDEFNRWASPVQDNLVRVVAENLVAILGTPRVTLYPTLAADVEFRVQIGAELRIGAGKSASLDAVWTVRRIKDRKTETGRTSVRERSWQLRPLAAAQSRRRARPGHRRCSARSIALRSKWHWRP